MRTAGELVDRAAAVNWHAVRLYRAADRLDRRGWSRLALVVSALNRIVTGVEIEPGARFGPGMVIQHGHGIVVNEEVRAGRNCRLYQNVTLGETGNALGAPIVGDDVTLYAGAKVLGPILIGDGATIGANSVVLRDVPPGATVVGAPARILGQPRDSPVTGQL